MKTRRTPVLRGLAVLLLAAVLVAAVVDRIGSGVPVGTGSGVAATQPRALPAFSSVDLTGDNNVMVQVGASRSVVVHADTNLLERVTTRVHSGRLVIGTAPGNLSAKSPMFVAVGLPDLRSLRLQGDGNIKVTRINSRDLRVELAGTGNIEAAGATAKVDVTISGEGTAMLRGLVARDAEAEISGDGSITLTTTRSLAATVSGTGTVLYGGNPSRVTRTVTGSGAISPG